MKSILSSTVARVDCAVCALEIETGKLNRPYLLTDELSSCVYNDNSLKKLEFEQKWPKTNKKNRQVSKILFFSNLQKLNNFFLN